MAVLFRQVAEVAEACSATASRLAKRAAMEAAVRVAHAEDSDGNSAGLLCQYLAGQPFAEADPRKLNAGGALLSRALKEVSGASDAALTAAYRRHGDMGAAAFDVWPKGDEGPGSRAKGKDSVTLSEVAAAFAAMAVAPSTKARGLQVESLLRRASALEAKYLLKLMLGDMRIGVKQSLVEEAIAVAAGAEVAAVRHAVMLEADLGRAVQRAFAGTLGEARMSLFHPLGFMLASPVETPEEAVARFTEPAPKPVKEKKPAKRKKKGAVEDVIALDAAEQGYAEDVAAESVVLAQEPTSQNRDLGHPVTGQADLNADSSAALRNDNKEGLRNDNKEGFWNDNKEALRNDNERDIAASAAPGVLAFLEDKYDGMRAQVHCGDAAQPGRVAIYSRNREDITASFPELCEAFAGITEPLILDGEILGWDFAADHALPFAVLGQRIGRKVVSDAMRAQVPVVFMAFDLLFADGELLLPLPLSERRARLEALVARAGESATSTLAAPKEAPAQSGLFAQASDAPAAERLVRLRLSPAQRVADAEAIDRAYRDARARKNEGVMLKAAGSAYLPGRRGLAWVKLKRELATLDVVITGAEFGNGRRAGLLSDYTFAVRGADGELLNVGKAYSGVTDAEIAELTAWLQEHTLDDHGHFRTVEPLRVIEVAFNNVMRSTRHASGFALRFPRILRIRDDKPLNEIDTLQRVEEIYQSQPDRPVDVE